MVFMFDTNKNTFIMKTRSITRKQKNVRTLLSLGFISLLSLMASTAFGQTKERTVTGVVNTANGPLPYAAITLKGSLVGVQADENGAFTFPKVLKENDVLIISSLAYEDYEVTITGDTTYIEPFLEGTEIVIIGALRTQPAHCKSSID
jgi:hypothetical protein